MSLPCAPGLNTTPPHCLRPQVQHGRYWAVLSLQEAEALRGVLHQRQRDPLVPGARACVALRAVHHGGAVLGASYGFAEHAKPPAPQQVLAATQALRFVDSETQFTSRELAAVLRAVQANPCPDRERFFADVRQCRRRQAVALSGTPVSQVRRRGRGVC